MMILKNKLLQTRICCILLGIAAILVNIKSVIVDFNVDSEYALVTSYRMLRGDKMFTQMWEPHQTSAFLTTFLMWLYMSFTKTTTGIVLFLHTMGTLLYGVLSIATYKILSRWVKPLIAFLMSIFLFTVRAKGSVFPEFSNMQVGFSVLVFLCLLLFLEHQEKKKYLLGASLCLCLQILSYPSCLIVYFGVVALLLTYSREKWKNVILFSVSCFMQGMGYVLFFVRRMGIADFIGNIKNIVNADSFHGVDAPRGQSYFFFFNKGVIWLAGCFGVTLLVCLFLRIVFHKKIGSKAVLIFSVVVMLSEMAFTRDTVLYSIVYFFIIYGGMKGVRYCSDREKRIYIVGLVLSMANFFAVVLLINQEILCASAYLILGVMAAFLPISKWADSNIDITHKLLRQGVLLAFCIMLLFRRGINVTATGGSPVNIFDLKGIVLDGPALGIVANYMGAYTIKCDMEDWKIYVNPQDSLLIVGEYAVNVMPYLYQDVTISVHSTICTPTYDEKLAEYWQQNPEKVPNVIAVSCWYGDLHVSESNWIFQWMEEEFGEVVYEDGRYWRFYRAAKDASEK